MRSTGWFLRDLPTAELSTQFIGHGGSDPGVQTVMLSTVDRRVAVVLFSNTSGGLADRAFDAIFLALKAYGDSQLRSEAVAEANLVGIRVARG